MVDPELQWHAIDATDACRRLDVDPTHGLSNDKAGSRLAEVGPNTLPEPDRPSALIRLLKQFLNPLVGALLVAAVIAVIVAFVGESEPGPVWMRFTDPAAILLIVVLNAMLGFFQERRAEQALDALRRLESPRAQVRRDGELREISAGELVPGDIVQLDTGSAVPADLRLLKATQLGIDESALTGESAPAEKNPAEQLDEQLGVADQSTMAFLGTIVTRGTARGVVVRTGENTELGKIGRMIREAPETQTPLEEKVAQLGRLILIACLAISALLLVIGLARGMASWPVLLLTAVSLAVAAIPEGLPAITTITLALGMQRMARRGAIIRRLPAVETLGAATVICSDKTGTLTQNKMRVRHVESLDEQWDVDSTETNEGSLSETLRALLETAVLCNQAELQSSDTAKGSATGDPTEVALLELARTFGITRADVLTTRDVVDEIPFDSERKRMTVLVHSQSEYVAHVKGSPEVVLDRCTTAKTASGVTDLDDQAKTRLHERIEHHAGRGLRVLMLAERRLSTGTDTAAAELEAELTLLGIVAMHDPPRPEAQAAIEECRAAGIRVIMITGDHPHTAQAIARELGLSGNVTVGSDLPDADDSRLDTVMDETAVFARVNPAHKLSIVRALQRRGHVVAMTGDGVNDAPALREAQIGVAMGKGGTDVARQASEMVLIDDNFATIVHAVREGRAIFENIRKFVFFLNSSNAGLVIAVVLGSFFTWMPQLTPLQLLWINLVTNGLPALALGIDPPERNQMREPPRPPHAAIFRLREALGVIYVGSWMGLSALALFWLPQLTPELFVRDDETAPMLQARTMAFAVLAFAPLFHAFNARSTDASILSVGLFSNPMLWGAVAVSAGAQLLAVTIPALHPLFHTTSLSGTQWLITVGVAALPIPAVEVSKAIGRRYRLGDRGRPV